MNSHILLITCDDEPGLVHKVTGALYRREANVVANAEFVEADDRRFFMRTEYAGNLDREAMLAELRELLPDGAEIRLVDRRTQRLVVLATREPHCLGDLLIRCSFQDLPAEILAVVSNHDHLRGLTDGFGLPYHHLPHAGKSREEHEDEVRSILREYDADYLVLAKYMRVLTPSFVDAYSHRMVNIHHSFLPAFIGANPYRQAYERGVKIIGATAHFVTSNLDEGPIIAQDVVPVDHRRSPAEMAQAGHDVEKIVLARALRLVLEERVFVHGNKTIIFD